VDTDASATRTILDQGYTILDGGKEIGSRRLVVTESDQALSIADETSLALTFDGAPLGIVELDVSAVYSVAGDTPRLMRATTSAKEQGALLMHGSVEFSSEQAVAKWTTYKDGGRKLEPPRKQQATLKQPPPGPLMLDSTIQVVGPLLLPEDGERKFVRVEFNDEAREGEAPVAYEAGWRLRRTTPPEEAGFTITIFKPESDKPEMTWEYDSQGNCQSIQLAPTTVMKPNTTAAAPRIEPSPSLRKQLAELSKRGIVDWLAMDADKVAARYAPQVRIAGFEPVENDAKTIGILHDRDKPAFWKEYFKRRPFVDIHKRASLDMYDIAGMSVMNKTQCEQHELETISDIGTTMNADEFAVYIPVQPGRDNPLDRSIFSLIPSKLEVYRKIDGRWLITATRDLFD
jgi:hypothetical protein